MNICRMNYKINRFVSFFRCDIPQLLKNLWLFRSQLWWYRWFDYDGMLAFMQKCCEDMAIKTEKYGNRSIISRSKKIARAIK